MINTRNSIVTVEFSQAKTLLDIGNFIGHALLFTAHGIFGPQWASISVAVAEATTKITANVKTLVVKYRKLYRKRKVSS